ncbi:MAG: hypothetical protein GY859_44395 [Desulfobacterales bacterium]|nr:hypothetical protein [Desulfobacterales bacterium]
MSISRFYDDKIALIMDIEPWDQEFETAINQVTEISRQTEGRLKYVRRRASGRNPAS